MLSSNIPDFNAHGGAIINSTETEGGRDMLLNKEVNLLIENLKSQKKNDSDLNHRLNLLPKGIKGDAKKNLCNFGQNRPQVRTTKIKLKKAVSVVNGSVSYLISNENKKLSLFKNKDDVEDELFTFNKKEIDHNYKFGFDDSENPGVALTKEEKKKIATGADNKLRLRTIQFLVETNEQVIHNLKLNYKILANWLNYVGYLSRSEFESALKSIGIGYDRKLYDKLFWLFDMNNDGIIDEKEFILINNLFKGHTVEEKVKIFFSLCDCENEGFLDEVKIKSMFKKKIVAEDIGLRSTKINVSKKTQQLINLVQPIKKSEIKLYEFIKAAKNNALLEEIIEDSI